MTPATLTRTDDLLSSCRTLSSTLTRVVTALRPPVDANGIELAHHAEALSAGALPGPVKGSIDLDGERRALAAELRDGDTKAAWHRAEHLLDATNRILADDPTFITPFDGNALPAPKAAAVEPPSHQPTLAEQVETALGSACYRWNIASRTAAGEEYIVIDEDAGAVSIRLRFDTTAPGLHSDLVTALNHLGLNLDYDTPED